MGYQYTAIGDSLTKGFGALPGHGFVPVYRRMAENRLGAAVATANLGINGLTTAELMQRLRGSSMYRQAIREADIITLSIGGNDLIRAARGAAGYPGSQGRVLRSALQECKQNFSGLIGTLEQLKAGARKPYIIRVVGLYNPYPRIAAATDWVLEFNRHAARYSSRVVGFAPIYNDFSGNEGNLLFIDHVHPNGRGYRVIAEKLSALGYGRLG